MKVFTVITEDKVFRNQREWITNKEYFDKWLIHFTDLKNDSKSTTAERIANLEKEFTEEEKKILEFWKTFFEKLLVNDDTEVLRTSELVDNDSGIIKVSRSIFIKAYKDKVYKLLEDRKYDCSPEERKNLQIEIENLTMNFSEESVFASSPDIANLMIKDKKPNANAKEFLRQKYKVDRVGDRMTILRDNDVDGLSIEEKKIVHPLLSKEDIELLSFFGQYTIETLLVHTLCYLFHNENYVSVASLIDRIEKSIRQHVQSVKDNSKVTSTSEVIKTKKEYPFGTALVEYLISCKVIEITLRNLDDIKSCEMEEGIPNKFVKSVKKKGQSFYREKSNFASCTFNTALLPIKFNLPMVYPPVDWHYDANNIKNQYYLSINDLSGGFLTSKDGSFYDNYRILSSPNSHDFYIYFGDIHNVSLAVDKADRFCESINRLQGQPFKINSEFLSFITQNVDKMVLQGLLMPEFLSNITMNDATKLLRECYMTYESIHSIYKFSELVEILSKKVQQSRYEQTIIDMARAYDGYEFYYPAFLDFRGRIYRSGIFHFHERDFARSLIHIVDKKTRIETDAADSYLRRFLIATAFHIMKFSTDKAAYELIVDLLKLNVNRNLIIEKNLIKFMKDIEPIKCKNIYQLLANIVVYAYSKDDPEKLEKMYLSVPITQDASASAYQIMSYYLLDKEMAMRTNLIRRSPNSDSEDIYIYFLSELRPYLENSLSDNPSLLKVTDKLTRKMVKGLFMPMIYGKTIGSTISDLKISLSKYIVPKESFILASHIFKFWKEKYYSHQVLMKLIPLLGRFVSAVDRPVRYGSKYFYTLQDYRVMSRNSVYVYDKNTRKRRSVTLTFSSDKRDKRKSETSTFVNFIHQKDATIAIEMVEKMSLNNIPIYTVHDNFISNTANCEKLHSMYSGIFQDMDPPLLDINKFIYLNIIQPHTYNGNRDVHYDRLYFVFPLPFLKEIFNQWERPKSENKKKWETNIERILNYYSEYCLAVCGSDSTKLDAEKRYNVHFQRYLSFIKKIDGKYCIYH